jgi:hypothetical protein
MLGLCRLWHRGALPFIDNEADNENAPPAGQVAEMVVPAHARALATGAALATSLDTSPAVVVSMYAYAHATHDMSRRSA